MRACVLPNADNCEPRTQSVRKELHTFIVVLGDRLHRISSSSLRTHLHTNSRASCVFTPDGEETNTLCCVQFMNILCTLKISMSFVYFVLGSVSLFCFDIVRSYLPPICSTFEKENCVHMLVCANETVGSRDVPKKPYGERHFVNN